MLEPGRGLVSDTCLLVSLIISRVNRRGTTWLFLDAGVYNALYEAVAFQGSTVYPVTSCRNSNARAARFSSRSDGRRFRCSPP